MKKPNHFVSCLLLWGLLLVAGGSNVFASLPDEDGDGIPDASDECPSLPTTNTIEGTAGNDRLRGTSGNDLIRGLGGNDKISGRGGNDCLVGGEGKDQIKGGAGKDTIHGNAGNDRLWGDRGNDVLCGGDGNDRFQDRRGRNTMDGGPGKDRFLKGKKDSIFDGANSSYLCQSFGGGPTVTVNPNTVIVGADQFKQILRTIPNEDGSTQLVTAPTSTLGRALAVGSVVQVVSGADAQFPLGFAGKVVDVTTASDGSTSAVLANATLADVVQESHVQTGEMALDSTNFIGIITPKAVQVLESANFTSSSTLKKGSRMKAVAGPRCGIDVMDAKGDITLDCVMSLPEMVDPASRLQPHSRDGKATVSVSGHIRNLKVIEDHDISGTSLNSLNMRVTGDIDVEMKLHGDFTVDLGFFSQAWREVESEQFKMLGITGLNSSDKHGKFPVGGLVFSMPCPPPRAVQYSPGTHKPHCDRRKQAG